MEPRSAAAAAATVATMVPPAEADAEAPLPTLLTSRHPHYKPAATCQASQCSPAGECGPAAVPGVPGAARKLRVRNTFIDTSAERSPSLERFYQEREVRTCPGSHVGRLEHFLRGVGGRPGEEPEEGGGDQEESALLQDWSPRSRQTSDTKTTGSTGCPPGISLAQDLEAVAGQMHYFWGRDHPSTLAPGLYAAQPPELCEGGADAAPDASVPQPPRWAPTVLSLASALDQAVAHAELPAGYSCPWAADPMEIGAGMDCSYFYGNETAPMPFPQGLPTAHGHGHGGDLAGWQLPPLTPPPEGPAVPLWHPGSPQLPGTSVAAALAAPDQPPTLPTQLPPAPFSNPPPVPATALAPATVCGGGPAPPLPEAPAPGSPFSLDLAGHQGWSKPNAFFHTTNGAAAAAAGCGGAPAPPPPDALAPETPELPGAASPAGRQGGWNRPSALLHAAAMAAPAASSNGASVPSSPDTLALGSPKLPSVGSAGHQSGRCKPCAFFHTVGCGNGACCQFCHLCDAGEKKRRRKEKLELRRSARKSKQTPRVA